MAEYRLLHTSLSLKIERRGAREAAAERGWAGRAKQAEQRVLGTPVVTPTDTGTTSTNHIETLSYRQLKGVVAYYLLARASVPCTVVRAV